MNRLTFLKHLFGLSGLALFTPGLQPVVSANPLKDMFPSWDLPDIQSLLPEPVILKSVELLMAEGEMMMVASSKDGVKGVTVCNQRMPNLVSLLKGLVIPHFVGKDARNLTALTDAAYRLNSNYKYTGMPLWNCIGSVEIAVWDLLGKLANRPVHHLLGKQVRNQYEVYLSSFDRDSTPEAVADFLGQKVADTGAKGVKIKVGGRMRNTPEDDARTRKLLPTVRKMLGDQTIIYADANGSYTAKEGIEVGKLLKDYGIAIFEEPCNFEDEEGLQTVNQALNQVILAGGEQDTSLYKFQRLSRNNVYDLLQPDLYYNGGIVRALTVSRIAQETGKNIAPHTPKADPLIAPFWQFAAVCPNLYGLQEYPSTYPQQPPNWYAPAIQIKNGIMQIPETAGLGIQYDEHIWKTAQRII